MNEFEARLEIARVIRGVLLDLIEGEVTPDDELGMTDVADMILEALDLEVAIEPSGLVAGENGRIVVTLDVSPPEAGDE